MPKPTARRTALINRNTNETKIQVSLSLDGGPLDPLPDNDDFSPANVAPNAPIPPQTATHHASQLVGSQQIWIWTGVGFLDHMLHAWSKHAGWSLRVRCRGDLASTSSLSFLCLFLVQSFLIFLFDLRCSKNRIEEKLAMIGIENQRLIQVS